LKKNAVKELELKSKYSKLKQEGRLDKYLKKTRKKTASKERKLMPRQRRSASNDDQEEDEKGE